MGVFGFLQPTHAATNANKMRLQHLCAVIHMQLMNHNNYYFDHRKNMNASNWSPCHDKDGDGFGISGPYL